MLNLSYLNLQTRHLLGSGSFAQVYECYDTIQKKEYAVKVIKKQSMSSSKLKSFAKEAEILGSIDHKNVVKFYSFNQTQHYLVIKMQLIKGGTLKQLIDYKKLKNLTLSEQKIALFMRNLLEGIRYLHQLNIIHRDLKPQNILFESKEDLSTVKIVDFGLSAKLDVHQTKNVKAQCGTLLYMAPQILNKPSYTKSVDIWACAVIMYMMFNKGCHPFYSSGMTVEEYKLKLRNNQFPPLSNQLAQNLIQKMTRYEYEQRYKVNQALKHPWITRNKDDQIPLSIHQSFRSFDSTNQIIHIIKIFMILGNCMPHEKGKVDQNYLYKLQNFISDNEAIRVVSPSRRKMRDKNQQVFIKMKYILGSSRPIKDSEALGCTQIDQQCSPTLKKHQNFYISLFERDRSGDLSISSRDCSIDKQSFSSSQKQSKQFRYNSELKQDNQSINQDEQKQQNYLKLNLQKLNDSSIDKQIQQKVELQIRQSVNALKNQSKNDLKKRIFQKKPSFDQKLTIGIEKQKKFEKKYSFGLGEEKKQIISQSNSQLSSSVRQIFTRRAITPMKNISTKPMVFSVTSKNITARK